MNFKNLKLYFRLFKRAFVVYKGKFFLLLVLGLLTGLMGGIGVAAIIPLFSFITHQETPGADFVTHVVKIAFSFLGIEYTVTTVLVAMFALFILKAILGFFAQYINAQTGTDYEHRTRSRLFKTTLSASWPYLSKQRVGHLEKVLTEDTYQSAHSIFYVSNILLTVTNLLMYAYVGFRIAPAVAVIAVASGGIVIFTLKKTLFKATKRISKKLSLTYKIIANFVNETMIGAKMVKAMGLEKTMVHRGIERFRELKAIRKELAWYNAIGSVILEPISFIFIAVLFALAYKSAQFQIGSFAALIYLIQKIFTFINSIQGNLQQISQVVPNLQAVMSYQKDARTYAEQSESSLPYAFEHEIAFSHVQFAYPGKEDILADVNFRIPKGNMVGLIGPSGVGKTTVVDLMLRLMVPTKGAVTVDGNDLALLPLKTWRHHLGYVAQEPFLINDTIENNIRLFDDSISQEAMIHAAQQAHIYDAIMEQPKQFQTEVGERGLALSGGQRQRIVLARILVRHPEFLILDEATSSLDVESETFIHKTIHDLKGTITIFMIAHRLSSVMNCDRLFVLDKGVIVEEGVPQTLLADPDSYFHRMYNIAIEQGQKTV